MDLVEDTTTSPRGGVAGLLTSFRIACRQATSTSPAEREAERQRRANVSAAAIAREQREARLARFRASVGCRLVGATLENFRLHSAPQYRDAQRAARQVIVDYARNLLEHIKAGVGLWVRGPCGVGKDHLVVSLAMKALAEHSLKILRVTGAELARKTRAAMRDNAEQELQDFLFRPDVLILSDPLPGIGELSAFQAQSMFEFVDVRNEHAKPLWVTLNVASNAEADQRLTPAIADRLRHGAVEIVCDWPSWRTEVRV